MMTRAADPHRSDEELARLAARSPDSPEGRNAAGALLGRYTRVVYRWCYGYVRDPYLAEDLAQDVLLRAYRNLGDFEGWGRFSAWLFVVARNLGLDAVRRQARRRREEEPAEMLPDPHSGPDAEFAAREAEAELLALIRGRLSTQEQDALWLRCIEKMPVDTITRVLGIPQASGARAVLQNARRKLRSALGGRYPALVGDDDD
jgi:RNA polymerase sigma-70 factor (ECF subfamily)